MEKHTLTKYTGDKNTLRSLLDRIKHYLGLIKTEAENLALKTSDNQVINSESKLEQVADAIVSIAHNTADDATVKGTGIAISGNSITLDAGKTTTLPVGYYGTAVTISATSLSDQSKGTATAEDILADKTAWVEGRQITGTIPVQTTYAYNADVEVKTSEEGEQSAEIKTFEIPAGYYAQPIVVTPRFLDRTNYESIINTTTFTANGDGVFYPYSYDGKSYDYFTQVTIGKAAINTTTEDGTIVTTEGWISKTDEFKLAEGTYNTAKANVTIDNTKGTATVNRSTGGYAPASIAVELPTNADLASKQTATVKFEGDKATTTATVNVPAGYYKTKQTVEVSGEVAITQGSHTMLPSYVLQSGETATGTIDSQYVKDTVTAGYIGTGSNTIYKVQDAILGTPSVDVAKATVTIPVTAGWRNDNISYTYGKTQVAETITPSSVSKTIEAGTYLTGAVTINPVTVDNTNVTYNSTSGTPSANNIVNVVGAVVTTKPSSGATTSFYDTVDLSSLLNEMSNL